MGDFTKAEKIAVKYLLDWGRFAEVDFPDAIVSSYFDLLSANNTERLEAVNNLCKHVKGILGEAKSKEVEQELLSCLI